MAKARTLFRRFRTVLWTALTLVVLLAAILVGIGKILMPYSVRYQPQLEAWLSREFQQPVVVDSFTGEWKAFGPRISFEGVTLLGDGQGEGDIAIHRAALDIKPLNALIPNRPLYSFRIIGADLELVRTPDGRYELSGLGVSGRSSGRSDNSGLRNITSVGEIRLEDSSLSFDDEDRGIHIQLTGMKGRLQLNGSELSTELEANISDEFKTRVIGDLKATLMIKLGEDQHLSSARWHVKSGELMISELVQQLPYHALIPRSGWLNAEVWGEWSQDSDQLMEGVVDLRESTLSESPRLMQLDHLNTRFRWDFSERKVWRLDLSDLTIKQDGEEWSSSHLSVGRNIPGNLGIWVSSDFVDIEFPLQLTQRIMDNYKTVWPGLMPRQIRGELHGFDLVLDSRWKMFQLSGEMKGIDAWEWDKYPDVAGLNGQLDLLDGEGEAVFGGEGIRLDWPKNFRRQAVVDIPECTMEILWGKPGAWRIDARECVIENADFSISGRSRFAGNEGKPAMDINMLISRANLAQLDDFWPASLMTPTVIDWLETGVVAGHASNGRFTMRGDMDDWPFTAHQGLLLASADVSDSELSYADGWPNAENIDMTLGFRNTTMTGDGQIGAMSGVPVQKVTAVIDDFKQPVLKMDYSANASMPAIVGFIGNTPLLDDVDLDLDQFQLDSQATTSGTLTVPLRSGLGELSINGKLGLSGNQFVELKSGIELQGLTGEISYDRQGMKATDLTATFRDYPAVLSLAADWDGDDVFTANLTGNFPIDELIPESIMESEPLLKKLSGSSDWDIGLVVGKVDGQSERETWLDMSSDLTGVTLGLPVPLYKAEKDVMPLKVRYPVKASPEVMTIAMQDIATLQFEFDEETGDTSSAHIQFGPEPGQLPGEGLFSLSGFARDFDLDQWMDVVIERFSQTQEEEGLKLGLVSLNTSQMKFLNRNFSDVSLTVAYDNDVLSGTVDSSGISGMVRYSSSDDGSHSLSAELDHLFMPEPVDEGMKMDTDPSQLPEMHLYAKQFTYMGLELGETRIEAYPIQNGLRIDSVEAVSPELNFQARGDWLTVEGGSRSDFKIILTSESLGSLMNMMEISSVLEGGQTILSYDAWWPGPPAAFALAQLNGEMNINVSDGKILDVDAGAGRVVGLLSIAALPRRLALDFRDVFATGFSFDHAIGKITLESGTAYTEDLVLESTAATMSIKGSSNLVEQEFDYVMTVRPGVSQTLPALGAVIGGPGGAAAGLALQGLLRRSLGNATEAIYTIYGPWSSPVVEPVIAEIPGVEEAVNDANLIDTTGKEGTGNE